MKKNKPAFTLIELLVVIAIIGILATISVLALSNARAKSRDAKRVGDMKQIQTALELFFNDQNRYPTINEWNTGQIFSTTTDATSTYLQVIPSAPTPADGSCNDSQNVVDYISNSDGSSYSISFCLGNTTGTLTPGPKCLTPGGIIDIDCSCGGPMIDIRDSQSYPTVRIGGQCWMAKNMNTTMALLDSVSEEINNHIFRKGHRVAGLSSALIGSGMAFQYDLFKKRMTEIKAIGGFDKELELTMLRYRIKIEYLDDALVLDEKVQKQAVFENQRRRWLSAQFVYFRRFALDGLIQFLTRFNIDYLDKVYQMIQPPRILLLGIMTILTAIMGAASLINYMWTSEFLALSFLCWFVVWILTVLAFAFSVNRKFYTKQTLLALLTLPMGFWLMFRSLFKLKGANKTFIHTQHGVTENKSNQK
jgi:prepilin-type N-terminal cleavage/methylation domain-containing protein